MNLRAEAVGSFETHPMAEEAVVELQQKGADRASLMVISGDLHPGRHVVGFYNRSDRIITWGRRGAIGGGIWGLLLSLWFFWIPGIGLLLVTIPVVIGAMSLGLLGAMAAFVYGLGIPKDSLLRYAAGAQDGPYVVMCHGTEQEIRSARYTVDHAKSLAAMLNMPVAGA